VRWIGQHIVDFIARFRSDVYLEDISSGTIASGGNLGLDSNSKIVKATKYQYQYISFLSNMTTASNWKGMSANGISNHSWNQTLATSGTTVDSSTGTVPVACVGAGIIIPHASTLVGFSATGMGGSDHQYELGLMVGVPTFNDAATFSATLRAYAAAVVDGPDNNYSGRPLAIQDLSRSYSITAGHSIYPCVKSASGSGTNKVSWTIVLKTPIT
tara:strand:- start:51 stop:692 length:642 start_codon:yes stop_codon:yes gene_type:complete